MSPVLGKASTRATLKYHLFVPVGHNINSKALFIFLTHNLSHGRKYVSATAPLGCIV
jgi:hypothetical protein